MTTVVLDWASVVCRYIKLKVEVQTVQLKDSPPNSEEMMVRARAELLRGMPALALMYPHCCFTAFSVHFFFIGGE